MSTRSTTARQRRRSWLCPRVAGLKEKKLTLKWKVMMSSTDKFLGVDQETVSSKVVCYHHTVFYLVFEQVDLLGRTVLNESIFTHQWPCPKGACVQSTSWSCSLKSRGWGKQFDFSETLIFGRFDLFCRRVHKLIDMFKTVHQFTHLGDDNQMIIEVGDFVVRDGSMKKWQAWNLFVRFTGFPKLIGRICPHQEETTDCINACAKNNTVQWC